MFTANAGVFPSVALSANAEAGQAGQIAELQPVHTRDAVRCSFHMLETAGAVVSRA